MVTLSGIMTEVRAVAAAKVCGLILVTPCGITMEVRAVAALKALDPMLVTLDGIVTEVSSVAPANARSPIDVTVFRMLYVDRLLAAGYWIKVVLFLSYKTPSTEA